MQSRYRIASKSVTLLAGLTLATALSGCALRAGLPAADSPVGSESAGPSNGGSPLAVRADYGKIPLAFEENRGQTDPAVSFLSRGSGYTLFLTATEAVLSLRSPSPKTSPGRKRSLERAATPPPAVLRMRLVGANEAPGIAGQEPLPGQSNYFIGNDPAEWRTGIPTWAKVRYDGVYPGVDLVYYGTDQRRLEYDFVIAPGADPSVIRIAFEGAKALRLEDSGDLVLETGSGEVIERAPLVYQEADGGRAAVAGAYELLDERTVGFRIAAYDRERPLVIDPVLVYSTYLGGSALDSAEDIAVDHNGYAYVTGTTASSDFPSHGAYQPPIGGGEDAFLTKLDPSGSSIVFSTYFGGSDADYGFGVDVDPFYGDPVVAGATWSTNFPTSTTGGLSVGALQPANAGLQDAFVLKLHSTGTLLMYSTYLGGSDIEAAYACAVSSSTQFVIAGVTRSTDFPVKSPAQLTHGGYDDGFVSSFSLSGGTSTNLLYSTFLGGAFYDRVEDVAADASGNAYLTGVTHGFGFPTNGSPPQPFCDDDGDAFVTKLALLGTFVYSTCLGGRNFDLGSGIAVDASGNAYVTGETLSTDFPLHNPRQGDAGGFDAFITKINAAGSGLAYSTYLGGSGSDFGTSIAVDAAGSAHVAGWTSSSDFPKTANAPQGSLAGNYDGVVTKLSGAGTALVYSTYLGGTGYDAVKAIDLDAAGNPHVAGTTASTDYPTANPSQTALAGDFDAFVAKLSLCGNGTLDPGEQCDAGAITGSAQSCCSSTCAYKPAGESCSDGQACTAPDQCNGSGRCQGPAVVCTGDACHDDGVCNPATGLCTTPPKPDGTACEDGNPCTGGDSCLAGSCTCGRIVLANPRDPNAVAECLTSVATTPESLAGALQCEVDGLSE